ncbi:hypothetical protein EVAR_82044_1 [Eumeta japonica]|uniref:Uncharacterized protein n=1 Tax=Eumeta variegata TaxID=151549 RepID=A0A4C1XMF3_EUMVA|nr:hypothetical protein EVAR_82044_1 [Eumeta japonica]
MQFRVESNHQFRDRKGKLSRRSWTMHWLRRLRTSAAPSPHWAGLDGLRQCSAERVEGWGRRASVSVFSAGGRAANRISAPAHETFMNGGEVASVLALNESTLCMRAIGAPDPLSQITQTRHVWPELSEGASTNSFEGIRTATGGLNYSPTVVNSMLSRRSAMATMTSTSLRDSRQAAMRPRNHALHPSEAAPIVDDVVEPCCHAAVSLVAVRGWVCSTGNKPHSQRTRTQGRTVFDVAFRPVAQFHPVPTTSSIGLLSSPSTHSSLHQISYSCTRTWQRTEQVREVAASAVAFHPTSESSGGQLPFSLSIIPISPPLDTVFLSKRPATH